jgi:tRNA(Leu) C34 or U34 (ribose-2'-O)-methylase TrmL
MKSLFFFNNGGKVEVQLVALSSKGNDYAKKDSWELNAEGWKLLGSEFSGVSSEVVYDNPIQVELPKGNIIINKR